MTDPKTPDAVPVCPLHGAEPLRPIFEAEDRFWGVPGRFTYARCSVCGTWVLSPRPTPDEMGPYYAGYYTGPHLEQGRKDAGKGVDDFRAKSVVQALAALGRPLKSGRVLDVGCGLAGFLARLKHRAGVQVRGVDFNARCREFAAESYGIEVDTGELAEQQYPDGAFDGVTSWHCLEHTYDPAAELAEMARITAPGGWLVIEVPTVSPLGALFKGRWLFLQPPTHLYHFTPKTLTSLVEGAGLKPLKLSRPWSPTEFAGSVLMTLGVRRFMPGVVFGKGWGARLWALLMFALMPLDLLITGGLALAGRGGVLRVVAEKPKAEG
ncbi:MAG: class I SAM-dependent methyltransferase [Bradymonadia bacterium]